jgi:GT2 family glycosyltransferase
MWSEPQSQDRNVEYTYPKVVEFLELHGFQQDQELDDRLYHFVRKDSNKVIQSLWVGDSLSTMERLSLASFLKNGHEVHLYTYGNVSNVPAGVVIKDAAEIVPTSLLDYRKFPKLAYFADMFRYKLLRERGGWWVDTDTVCIRPFDFKEETIISSEMTKGGKTHPNNGNLKAPLGSPIMTWLWNECMNKDPSKLQWGDTGPRLIKRAIERFKLEFAVKPPETFCPIPWWDSVSLNDPTATPIIPKNAYAVHFWNEQWSSTGQDKILPQPESLYAKLVQKYDTRIDLNRVTAVIKTLFRDHSLFHCVQTLKASFPFIHIIVADGGKTSPEKEAQLKSMGVDKYITLPQDCGLSAGRNRLVEECLTPYVMLCDDDFSFTPECHIERMLDLTEVVDIAGGLVYNLRNWSLCETGVGWDITGGNFVTRDGKTWVDGTRGETLNYKGIRYERADFILNFFIAKTDVVKRVKWDNSLKFFAEHIDFCLRAKTLGITSGRCLDSFVLHKAMDDVYDPSYVSIRKDYLNYRSLFEKKWGFPHPELLPGTTPTINEPAPRSTIEQAAKPAVVEPPPPPKNWHGWKEDFLQKKVDSLFKRFRFAVATIPNSGHYKQLCAIYPEHFEEIVDTPEGRRIIFVVGR